MLNHLFSQDILPILLAPERWKFVSARFTPDITPTASRGHMKWLRLNSHSHGHPEMLFILQGRGRYSLGGKSYPFEPGVVFFFDAFQEHDAGYAPVVTAGVHLWCGILRDTVAAWLDVYDSSRRSTQLWRRLFSEEEICFSPGRLFQAPQDALLPWQAKRAHLAAAVNLLILAVLQSGFARPGPPPAESFHKDVIEAIQRHIEQTAGRGSTIESLARIAGYSKFHFLRLFRKKTGRTVHEYINLCREARADEMLARGARKKAIAEALGFSHQSAFTRWRKEKIG